MLLLLFPQKPCVDTHVYLLSKVAENAKKHYRTNGFVIWSTLIPGGSQLSMRGT